MYIVRIIIMVYSCHREVRLGAKQAVDMSGQELVIVSRENKTLHFCYDYCFWSFDNESPDYASQATVYSCLAHPLLDSAFQGYNTCLFAYGQVIETSFHMKAKAFTFVHVHVVTMYMYIQCTCSFIN